LYDILPVLTKQNYAEWLAAAVSLTGRDWNIEIRKAKGQINEEDETHTHDDVLYEICRTCGRRHKITKNERTGTQEKETEDEE
jgi:ABC-type nickel/cobalt efflux system permease component RcnA